MASVRNLPYGFGANYETVIKIIGSKYVRCLVEKSDGKAKEIAKPEAQSMLQTLPLCNIRQRNGKFPDLNKPPGQQINNGVNIESQNKDGMEKYTSKQTETNVIRSVDSKELKPLNLHCVTAPCGDKSLSYIHSIKKPSFEAQNSKPFQQQGIQPELTETKNEDDSLLVLLRKEFELHPISLTALTSLNEELKEMDPRKSGFLSQAQLSTLLLKHDIPLQLPTVKLLFKRCSQANDQELIDYEKLIQLLILQASSKMQHTLPEKNQNKKNPSSWTSENTFLALKQILKEHNGELDFEKLTQRFLQEDQICSGLLSFPEVEDICQKHGLILHPGMMETLANLCDFGRRGRMQWKPFVELLQKVQTGMNPALLVCKRRNEDKAEDNSQIKEQYKLQTVNPWTSYDASDSEDQEAWIDRFRKMEKALYLSDVKNTGKLEKEKAKRLIHNYNQIYDLCLSPLKIDKAFRPFRYGQDMPLEPLLQYLKEL
ncbi:uncharacterized protein C1orf87 homolog isoform X1 [Pantherophis guttatus]|uniref:Uncharacterized protein C1orf87 homolog isoform X1 n=1 Tax=Pantherophis guttatus TaxID=94885 RepID=A0A6P9BII1_PANGU|nr:uncharacterized protein C1orf87 homolog isoform X1 [Pantherophis guttatus]XP_034271097.1 uncharacterized protein C1orf87 homolog isoform X1 [Pantherophis guttatus]XP_060545924.1 uncharacterized protein C1orf87 homolog isoform X1 [Pantherophis guttatus]